jgi:hypothetical protein
MATIQLSTGLKNQLASRVWVTSTSNISPFWGAAMPPLAYNGNYGGGGAVYIMKGAVPSDFTSLTSYNVRASDVLVGFKSINYDFASSSYANNVFTMNTALVQATGTGTATWFWIIQTGGGPNTPFQQIVGTIGTIGSGADLEISSTSIVTGSPYRISNLVFNMTDSWAIS